MDGSGAAGATGARGGQEGPPSSPSSRGAHRDGSPTWTLGFWAVAKWPQRGCCSCLSIWSSCDPDSHARPSHTRTRGPPPPAARSTAAAENHISFVASPRPTPQKRGNWNRDGDPARGHVALFSDQKGALSAGHFPHLILPPAPGLRLTPNLEVTWARVSEPPSCCSRVVFVYSQEGHTPPC